MPGFDLHPLVGDGDGTLSLRGSFRSAVTVNDGRAGESGGRLALVGRLVCDPLLPLLIGVDDPIIVEDRRFVAGDATLIDDVGDANVRGV